MMGISSKRLGKYHRKIGGLSCSFCVESIKKALLKLDGVEKVNVSMSHEEILVIYDPDKVSETQMREILTNLGFTIRDPRRVKAIEEQKKEEETVRKYLLLATLFTFTSIVIMALMWLGFRNYLFRWIMFTLALLTMFWPGWHIKRKAWYSLKAGIFNQHVLLEFGAFAGLVGGVLGLTLFPDFPSPDFFGVSIFLTSYHILGEWTSLFVRTRASQAVQRLLGLQPKTAVVIENGREILKNIDELKVGEVIRVRPGERIPIDGVIVNGYTTIDESIVTGESIPIEKEVGDDVVGGSINLTGLIEVEVTKVGEETFLHQIARYIEEARALKPGILIIVDKILKYYVPAILVVAVSAFIFWTLGSHLLYGAVNIEKAVFASLSVLVMGYPCALGMAMPLALIVGGGKAAEKGILMRSGEAFQILPSVKRIVLDKTGTLTTGELGIRDFISYEYDEETVLSFLGSAEKFSEHPVAKAIIHYIDNRKISYKDPQEFTVYPGLGVLAKVDGRKVVVGKLSFLLKNDIEIGEAGLRDIEALESEGKTVVGIGIDKKLRGIIALSDTLKKDALKTVEEMRRRGIELVMVTGDNRIIAESIARQLGIEKVYAEVLPNEKTDIIRRMQEEGVKIAMVGDGINDAPSLMQADVGIAIAAGTDIAIESADIIITGRNIGKVIEAIEIAKESYSKTKQNLFLAFLFNGLGVPLAATGLIHPSLAMVAMAASVSTILINSFGLRILGRLRRDSGKNSVMIYVPRMMCERCRDFIVDNLRDINGIIDMRIDLETKTLTISYDPKKFRVNNVKKKLEKHFKEIYILR